MCYLRGSHNVYQMEMEIIQMNKNSLKDRIIMPLNDETLDHVTGGTGDDETVCPLCRTPTIHYICMNLYCRNYGCYIEQEY